MSRGEMILWSRPKDINIDDMTNIVYKVLELLKNYGDELNGYSACDLTP